MNKNRIVQIAKKSTAVTMAAAIGVTPIIQLGTISFAGEVENKIQEVKVNLYKSDEDQESMASSTIYTKTFVEEQDGKYIYRVYFKELNLWIMSSRVSEISVYVNGFDSEKIKAKKIEGLDDTYLDGFEFERDNNDETEIKIQTVSVKAHNARLVFSDRLVEDKIESIPSASEFKDKEAYKARAAQVEAELRAITTYVDAKEYDVESKFADLEKGPSIEDLSPAREAKLSEIETIAPSANYIKNKEAYDAKVDEIKAELEALESLEEIQNYDLSNKFTGIKTDEEIAVEELEAAKKEKLAKIEEIVPSENYKESSEEYNTKLEEVKDEINALESVEEVEAYNIAEKFADIKTDEEISADTLEKAIELKLAKIEEIVPSENYTKNSEEYNTKLEEVKDEINALESIEEVDAYNIAEKFADIKTDVQIDAEELAQAREDKIKSIEEIVSALDYTQNKEAYDARVEKVKAEINLLNLEELEAYDIAAQFEDIEKDKTLDEVKAEKKLELDEIALTEEDKKNKTSDSIKKAEEKLEEDKKAALEEIEKAENMEALNQIILPTTEAAKTLLVEKKESGGGGGGSSQEKEKTYYAPVKLIKSGETEESMGNGALEQTAKIIVKGDKAEVHLSFKPMDLMGLHGHLLNLILVDEDGNRKNASVIKTYTDGGKTYPKTVKVVTTKNKEKINARVEVDAMNEIAPDIDATQPVDIVIDWENMTEKKSESKKDQGSSGSTISKEEEKEEKEISIEEALKDKIFARIMKNVQRISGEDRYQTSVNVSKKFFKKADNIVIASGENNADALVSGSYAKLEKAPILLTPKNKVNKTILEEITRLGGKNITIIGGEATISTEVQNELEAKGYKINRIAGADRYETSTLLAKEYMKKSNSKKIAIVNGQKNSDALTLSSLSSKKGMPVVMVASNEKSLEKLKDFGVNEVFAIGGEKSISEDLLKTINVKKKRIAGEDRYETALKIAELSYPNAKRLIIGNGENSVDTLSAGAITSRIEAPILLMKKENLSTKLIEKIKKTSGKDVYILGGKNTIEL